MCKCVVAVQSNVLVIYQCWIARMIDTISVLLYLVTNHCICKLLWYTMVSLRFLLSIIRSALLIYSLCASVPVCVFACFYVGGGGGVALKALRNDMGYRN